jgi:hypothetical protein
MQSFANNFLTLECIYKFDRKTEKIVFTIDMEEKIADLSAYYVLDYVYEELTNLQVIIAPSYITVVEPGEIEAIHKISRKDLSYQRSRSGSISGFPISGTETGTCKKVEIDTSENVI